MGTIRELQHALELAHYARRHRGALHVVAVGDCLSAADILLDLKLLGAYGLRCAAVARAPSDEGRRLLEALGGPHAGLALLDGAGVSSAVAAAVRTALARQQTPLVLLPDPGPAGDPPGPIERLAGDLALELYARRLLLLTGGLLDGHAVRPHVTLEEARTVAATAPADTAPLWRFVVERVERGLPGAVLLPGRTGVIFEELFTHHGAGTLVGDSLTEEIRPATLADIDDVRLLLRAEIARGVIRPVADDELACTITDHLVYTIDGFVVGTARLAPWGDGAELARFATLPRYRGRGRARQLCRALVDMARARGFRRIFALSIDERMWRFFESMGFRAAERETLPPEWQAGYDFSRPSRAFVRWLE